MTKSTRRDRPGHPFPPVFVETADVRLQSRLACTSKALKEAVGAHWRQTARVADIKVYVEGIRCPVSRQGVLDDLLAVDPRHPVAPRPDWHDGEPLDLRDGWPAWPNWHKAGYALANGGLYQVPVERRHHLTLECTTAHLSEEFRDCLLNGLGRHVKSLGVFMTIHVDIFAAAVQEGGLPSLVDLSLNEDWTTDFLRSVCIGCPALQRLELRKVTRGFHPSMRFPALQSLLVEFGEKDVAVAFAEAAQQGAFLTLVELHFKYCRIGDAEFAGIARALKHTRVEVLLLECNGSTDRWGAEVLLEDEDSLRRLKTLTLPPHVTITPRLREVMSASGVEGGQPETGSTAIVGLLALS